MAIEKAGWSQEMNSEQHLSTYHSFLKFSKWGIIGIVVLLIFMAWTLL